ncbi:TIM barrel protein [Phragmitibacter flavus]|uniref:TIM barrel protein n=1 Tax=Phragmitibacter flavus TaxID=2576071 RepID=A0A5R8KDK8_9BACT|nr:TIM barrel protein [Phragmitibacter flavus]TLD70396.1 TIM barrel protein [Phragmitibacter flavus]
MPSIESNRRSFLKAFAATAASSLLPGGAGLLAQEKKAGLKLSLAEWSLNKRIFKKAGAEPLDHLDFAKTAKSMGIDAVEYVSQCFDDKTAGADYLKEMKTRADGEGVKSLLIMVDREGNLGEPDEAKRQQTVENHLKWLDAAKFLGCHSIRVNAASNPKLTWEEQAKLAADGLHRLCVEGDKRGLFVVVENHGGLSSNGKWLTEVMKLADHARVGILPDFGNFYTDRAKGELYNPYLGLREFMPWVRGSMSAKAFDWDTGAGKFYTEDRREGRELTLDFERLIKIVVGAGYSGYVGIEYEGDKHPEEEGIKLTKQVLEELFAMVG